MASPKTVTTRNYNKQVRLVLKLSAELQCANEAIEKTKEKNKVLRKRLKEERSRLKHEIELCKTLEKTNTEYEQRIRDLQDIQDKTKRDNEHLRLAAATKNARVKGPLAKIEEQAANKTFTRVFQGGKCR